jgi:predicted ATPase
MANWLAACGRQIDNVRTALDRAFSTGGDAVTGVAFTAAAIPLGFQLSLSDECRGRVQQAPGQFASPHRLSVALRGGAYEGAVSFKGSGGR